jgi:hypothetical protein
VCLVSASQFRDALQRKALTRRLAEEGSSRLAQYAIRLPREGQVLLFRGSQCYGVAFLPGIARVPDHHCPPAQSMLSETAMSTMEELIATRAEFKFMSRQGSTEIVNRPAK